MSEQGPSRAGRKWVLAVLLAAVLLFVRADRNQLVREEIPRTGEVMEASIQVIDQPLDENTVLVEVVSPEAGWVVIRNQVERVEGDIIGFSLIPAGRQSAVRVEINPVRALTGLTAVLHRDLAPLGVFGYPVTDPPVLLGGEEVSQDFNLIELQAQPLAGSETGVFRIEMVGESFEPARVVIPVGTTITWINSTDTVHTVVAEDHLFLSSEIQPGEEFSFLFDQPGQYPYFCELNGAPGGRGMSGVILVGQ